MSIYVNGVEVQTVVETVSNDNYKQFRAALLGSSFADWANQSPSHASAISSSFAIQDYEQVKDDYARLAALYPPTTQQLTEWQQIADTHQVMLRFIPYAQPQ